MGTVHTIHIDKTTAMNQNTNQRTVHTIKIYIDKTTAMNQNTNQRTVHTIKNLHRQNYSNETYKAYWKEQYNKNNYPHWQN